MAEKRPLCLYGGRIEELRAADGLPGAGSPAPAESGLIVVPGRVNLTSFGTRATVSGRVWLYPVWFPRGLAGVDRLGCGVTTAVAGASISLGVYADTLNGANHRPGSLLAGVSGLDGATTGNKYGTLAAPLDMDAGQVYWLAQLSLGGAPTLRAIALAAMAPLGGVSDTGSNYDQIACAYDTGYSALPPDLTAVALTYSTSNPPFVALEVVP